MLWPFPEQRLLKPVLLQLVQLVENNHESNDNKWYDLIRTHLLDFVRRFLGPTSVAPVVGLGGSAGLHVEIGRLSGI